MQTNEYAHIYQAYLLRLWRDGEQAPWRASLQASGVTEVHSFADLEKLFHFLGDATNSLRAESSRPLPDWPPLVDIYHADDTAFAGSSAAQQGN